MKKVLVVLLALIMVFAMVACGDKEVSEDAQVYWLNFKPEFDQTAQDLAKAYTEETGVLVKVVTAASGTYQETLTAEMDKENAPTLFVVGNDAAVETWKDYCYDLTDTKIAAELNTDAYNLYDADGKLCSIGYCYECYGIIVNVDLLEKAGHSLDEIKDFASLKAVAEDIHAKAETLGFDAFTTSGMDDSSSWRFSGHLANMPLYYESVKNSWNGQPAEITGEFLDLFKNVWDLYINNSKVAPTTLADGGYDAEAEFKNGEAVFYQNGSWEYAAVSETVENLAMIPIYCGADGEEKAGLCCGTENCWAVNGNVSQEKIDATIDFMTWLVTSETGTQAMAKELGPIPYKSAATPENVFFANANEYTANGNYVVTWAFNYTPQVDDWRAGVVAAMNQYDANPSDETWALVKTAFVEGWATQYKAAHAE